MFGFFCRTPIHVFRTIQLKMQIYKNEVADIYIFDTFPFSREIADRIKTKKLFANVYYICDKDFLKSGKADSLRTTVYVSDFKNILKTKTYNQIFLYNIYGAFNELIFNVLRRNNEELTVNMLEDGPAIYHIQEYGEGVVQKYVYPLFRLKPYIKNIDYWWFSKPELMKPFGQGQKKPLPVVDKSDKEFVDVINYVFAYDSNPLIANADIIIMEECYWSDGLLPDGEDYQLYKKVAEAFKENNVVVKLHPRTKHNRYASEFQTVPANGIPWEVYALNMNMDKKILVSLSCATMVSTKLLYGEETHSLLLYPIIEDKIVNQNNGEKYLTDDRKAKIDSQIELYEKKEKFAKASSMIAAVDIISKWLLRNSDDC